MWKTMQQTTLAAALFFGLSSLPVVVGLAVASDDHVCKAQQNVATMTRSEAVTFGQSLGYSVTKVETEHGCFELSGTDRNGASIELTINPYGGKILPETGAH
ncbi:MAG: PepSY domain-containing protein [Rhodospirillaceae bacterium]|nr:PepSY domain-containing protein [Rhodospirillaceae bacterium]